MPFQNNDESPICQPQPTTSQLQDLGLGLGLSLTDSFAWSSVEEGDQEQLEITNEEYAENERRVTAAELARASITDSALAATGIDPDIEALCSEDFDPDLLFQLGPIKSKPKFLKNGLDFFSNMANVPELFMELAKQLRIQDLISLYAISRDFHETINGHLSYCMKGCARYMAPEGAKLFLFKFYESLCVPDPNGLPHPLREGEVRKVPGLKWLQMVVHREKTVRDILAAMARQGHRMPKGTALSLKKMWLIMDISTTANRIQAMHDQKLFTDIDIYNIQLFICKLDMRFNDPIHGPGDDSLRKLFLGQRGLTPLCNLLKRKAYLKQIDVVKLGIRYKHYVRPEYQGQEVFGVPPEKIGIGHLEGWGAGRVHLMRPDELILLESGRRRLRLKRYITDMMLWGYVDPITGLNTSASEEEKYMSGDEEKKRNGWTDYWNVESSDEGKGDGGDEDISEGEEGSS